MLALRRNLSLAEAALKAGQADVTVLLDAQRELGQTLLDPERDAALAAIELERAAGGSVAAPVESKAGVPSDPPRPLP